jgi:hypothetical protein
MADQYNSTTSLDKSSIASMLRKHQRAEEQGGFSIASSEPPQNKALELLAASMRPVWMDAKVDENGEMGKIEGTQAEFGVLPMCMLGLGWTFSHLCNVTLMFYAFYR